MSYVDEKKPDVFCVGRIVLDIFISHPVQKDKKGNFFQTDCVELYIGGTAANTAFILKKIGSTPILSGLVGTDAFGDVLIEKLKECSLYNPNIRKYDGHTSTSFITLNDYSEPSFIHLDGVNKYHTPSSLDLDSVKKCKYLHIGGVFLLPGFGIGAVDLLIDFARKNKIKISADTTHNLSNPDLIKNYDCLDVLFTNYEEASAIAKTEHIKSIIDFFMTQTNFKTIVIKMGPDGCIVISQKKHNSYKGFKIEPIDHCGAGDAFVGGFLHGLINKWDEKKTAVFANACGAFNCLFRGATNEAVTKEGIFSLFNIGEE